jgi:type I restriction enzyme S subunit
MIQADTLKPGWKLVKFGDVVRQVKDKVDPKKSGLERYIAGEHMDTDDLRIRRWGEINDNYLGPAFNMRFKPGQVLYGSRRTYLRKVAVPDFEGICANTTFVLEPKDSNILLPEFLPFIMQTESFNEHSIKQSKGSVNPYVNFTDLKWWEFALPPIDDQRKIREILLKSKNNYESVQNALSVFIALRKSAIDDLCTRYGGQFVLLGEVCEIQNGRSFPSNYYQDEGIRLLRPGNLGENGYLKWTINNTVHLPDSFKTKEPAYLIESGDILINLTAQSLEDGFMGRVCIARDNDVSLLNQRIGRLLFKSSLVIPEFIFRVLQTSKFQQHTVSMCEGTKVKHLFWRHIENFKFKIPDIKEQEEVVENLQKIDSAVATFILKQEQQKQLHFNLINKVSSNL